MQSEPNCVFFMLKVRSSLIFYCCYYYYPFKLRRVLATETIIVSTIHYCCYGFVSKLTDRSHLEVQHLECVPLYTSLALVPSS